MMPFPSVDDLINSVYTDLNTKDILNFSMAAPSAELLPSAKLNKAVMHVLRESKTSCLHYEHVQGNVLLRRQIVRQAFNWEGTPNEDDIVVTAGAVEALSLCVKAITQPGDTIAIESPAYFAVFQVMETHGPRVVEIPTDPVTDVDLDYLEQAIPRFDIKACLFVNNFNNPLGSCMLTQGKRHSL
jgi:DNA-binding transcriptional MocR family regulator